MSPASKSHVDRRKSTRKDISPAALKRHARELLRESAVLLKRNSRRVDASAVTKIEALAQSLMVQLQQDQAEPEQHATLLAALEELDQGLDDFFGAYRKSWLREYAEAIVWAVLLALLIRSFLFEAFSIPSGSMLPTLEIGDRLFVDKISYGLYMPLSASRLIHWNEPERGDVIVFEFGCEGDPNDGEDYIKRVVATAGDRIRMENNILFSNGKPVLTKTVADTECAIYSGQMDETASLAGECRCVRQEEAFEEKTYLTQHMKPSRIGHSWGPCMNRPDWPLREPLIRGPCRYFGDALENPNWPDVVVPEGHVFVMGDNRDRSEDGRYWGLVPLDKIKGKAFVIWWARNKSRLFTWLD
jgi:signal peptidase I